MGSTTGIGTRNHVTPNASDTTTTTPATTTKSQTTGPVDGRETRTPKAPVPPNASKAGLAAAIAPGAPKAEDNNFSWAGAALGYAGGAALAVGALALCATPPGAIAAVAALTIGAGGGAVAGGEYKRISHTVSHWLGN